MALVDFKPIRLRTNIDSSSGAVARPLKYCLGGARSTLMLLHKRLGIEQSFGDACRVAEEWVIENGRSAADMEDAYASTTSKVHAWVPLVLAIAYLREAELASLLDADKSWNALMATYFFIGINTGSAYEFSRKGNAKKKDRANDFAERCILVLNKICPVELWVSLTDLYRDLADELLKLDGFILGKDKASVERYELHKGRLVRKFQRLASGATRSVVFRAKIEECCREKPRPGRKPYTAKKPPAAKKPSASRKPSS